MFCVGSIPLKKWEWPLRPNNGGLRQVTNSKVVLGIRSHVSLCWLGFPIIGAEGPSGRYPGNVIVAVVPCPMALLSVRVPPWASISERVMARPRPVPPSLRARALSTR
jgi:hypothetical protein